MRHYLAIVIAVFIAAYIPTIGWALPQRAYFRRPTPVVGNPVNHAVFDGATTRLRVSSATPTGLSNTKTGTISFWMTLAADGASYSILTFGNGSISKFNVAKGASNVLVFQGWNSANTQILDIRSTNTVTAAMGWFHVMACWDLTNTSLRKIYINGVAETVNAVVYTNATLDYSSTSPRITVGASTADTPLTFLNGGIAELWFDDVYNDNIADYYTVGTGKAVALGSSGETPTGTSPPFYFSNGGSGNSWETNSGTAGALIRFGTLTTDGSPPQYP